MISLYIVFYSTSHVFEAEERLLAQGIECKVVPTPVTDKAYCGVCIKTGSIDAKQYVQDMEHCIIE